MGFETSQNTAGSAPKTRSIRVLVVDDHELLRDGIAALIAGGLAAKAGLFKVLLGALVALKKVIVLGLVAAAAFLRKLFGRKPTDAAAKP